MRSNKEGEIAETRHPSDGGGKLIEAMPVHWASFHKAPGQSAITETR